MRKAIVYASVHHGITLILSKRKTGDFIPRFFGCYASVFNLKNIFYRHFQVMGQPDCNLKRGITFSTFDAAYSLAAGTYGFSQICLNEIPFFTNIFNVLLIAIQSLPLLIVISRIMNLLLNLMKSRNFCTFAFSDYFSKNLKRVRFQNLDRTIFLI